MKSDGSGRRKVTEQAIVDPPSLSPDGKWMVAPVPEAAAAGSHPDNLVLTKAFPLDGGQPTILCQQYCVWNWDTTGELVYLIVGQWFNGTYVLPAVHGSEFPKLPAEGLGGREEVAAVKGAKLIPELVGGGLNDTVYPFTRTNVRRNLYRIPLP